MKLIGATTLSPGQASEVNRIPGAFPEEVKEGPVEGTSTLRRDADLVGNRWPLVEVCQTHKPEHKLNVG